MFDSLFAAKKVVPDLSFLGADMHSHLLPGIDDGLQTLEETILYIKELHQLGYKKLICTPHILPDIYPNTPEIILSKLTLVQGALQKHNIPVKIEAAAEYMVDIEMEQYVKSGKPLLTFGKNYILIEMSYLAAAPNIENVIFELKLKNLQPVLAHPERYSFYYQNFNAFERFIDLGCLLQVNLLSLLGYYGKVAKNIAEKLLKQNMVTFLGTDMHRDAHLSGLKQLSSKKEFYKLVTAAGLKNIELV